MKARNSAITAERLEKEEKAKADLVKIEEGVEMEEKEDQQIQGARVQKSGEAAKILKSATVEELKSQGLQEV